MREYVLVLLLAAMTTYLLSGMCRRVALRVNAVAKVRERDVHAVPVPYFGGVAILGGVAAAFLLATNLPFLGRHALLTHDAMAVLLASVVICVVGVIDDMIELSALAKLAGQVLAAAIVVTQGVRLYWIPLPNSIFALDQVTSILVTGLIIVVSANAVNFVDGLDGLAAGVVAIGAGAFFLYTYVLAYEQQIERATTASLITVAITGACLGFLPHNFSPARMFMGDSGALLLGLLMGTSMISLTGQLDSSAIQTSSGGLVPSWLPIILPVAAMALPLLDLVLAYVRRTWAGNWWFVADRQHLHHRLLQRGHSQTRAVVIMYLWTAVVSFGVIAIGIKPGRWSLIGVGSALLIALLVTALPARRQERAAAALATGAVKPPAVQEAAPAQATETPAEGPRSAAGNSA